MLNVIWKLGIFICILIMEELLQLSLKGLQNLEYPQLRPWNRRLYLLSVDQKLGIRKLLALLGGCIMTRFQNLLQLVSFYQLVLLWLGVSVISFIQTECKWVWLFSIDWTTNLCKDISSIKRILERKVSRHKNLNYKGLRLNL